MEFRLLGPLEVADHDRSVALGGIRQRSLLPVLMLHADEVVAIDPLDADLWGDAPPATATESIQIYVSRLRKELGPDRLDTRSPATFCASTRRSSTFPASISSRPGHRQWTR